MEARRRYGFPIPVIISGSELPNMGAGNEIEHLTTEPSLQTSQSKFLQGTLNKGQ